MSHNDTTWELTLLLLVPRSVFIICHLRPGLPSASVLLFNEALHYLVTCVGNIDCFGEKRILKSSFLFVLVVGHNYSQCYARLPLADFSCLLCSLDIIWLAQRASIRLRQIASVCEMIRNRVVNQDWVLSRWPQGSLQLLLHFLVWHVCLDSFHSLWVTASVNLILSLVTFIFTAFICWHHPAFNLLISRQFGWQG